MKSKNQTSPKAPKIKKAQKSGHKGFPPGTSGNPAGRPPGARNKSTLLAESMLEGEVEEIMRTIIDAALKGQHWALIWVANRLLPPRRSQPVVFDLPSMEGLKDLPAMYDALLEKVNRGEITLDEAEKFSGLFDAKRKAIETVELAEEVASLKAYLKVK